MKITIGRTVLYVLSEIDADAINRRRTNSGLIRDGRAQGTWPLGAQAHIGNPVNAGDIYPAVAVRVFGDGETPPVNLKVLLDGNDDYWATSRHEDARKTEATWHWPEVVNNGSQKVVCESPIPDHAATPASEPETVPAIPEGRNDPDATPEPQPATALN